MDLVYGPVIYAFSRTWYETSRWIIVYPLADYFFSLVSAKFLPSFCFLFFFALCWLSLCVCVHVFDIIKSDLSCVYFVARAYIELTECNPDSPMPSTNILKIQNQHCSWKKIRSQIHGKTTQINGRAARKRFYSYSSCSLNSSHAPTTSINQMFWYIFQPAIELRPIIIHLSLFFSILSLHSILSWTLLQRQQ